MTESNKTHLNVGIGSDNSFLLKVVRASVGFSRVPQMSTVKETQEAAGIPVSVQDSTDITQACSTILSLKPSNHPTKPIQVINTRRLREKEQRERVDDLLENL